MNLNFRLFSAIVLLAITISSCTEDFFTDDPVAVPVENPVIINFWSSSYSIHENNTEGINILVPFSGPAPHAGLIEIQVESTNAVYGTHYNTFPTSNNGLITISVVKGDVEAMFTLKPNNDDLLNGHKEILFKIIKASGGVQKGANLGYMIYLLDDELVARPKSYETIGGDRIKRTYEYDQKGRVAKVNWEKSTPLLRTGTDTYFYDNNDQLIRINEDLYHDTYYTWTNGRITKSEKNNNGSITQYVDYHYDAYNHIEAAAYYYLQGSGEFKLSLVINYLYFFDGNLFKVFKSIPMNGSEELQIISTHTYDGYVEGTSPFPMVNILPNINPQTKLPTYYRVAENGFDFVYQISYQFSADGKLVSRNVSGGAGSQVTNYDYY